MSNLPKKTYGELLREKSRENWDELYNDAFTGFQTLVSDYGDRCVIPVIDTPECEG